MPRGGERKGAGRKSTWVSGCKFEDTKLIRVPKAIADVLLKLAHRLDAGEDLELETKSKRQEKQALQQRVRELEHEVSKLKTESSHQQLELSFQPTQDNLVTKSKKEVQKELQTIRDKFLSDHPLGKSSPAYRGDKKKYDEFIKALLDVL